MTQESYEEYRKHKRKIEDQKRAYRLYRYHNSQRAKRQCWVCSKPMPTRSSRGRKADEAVFCPRCKKSKEAEYIRGQLK